MLQSKKLLKYLVFALFAILCNLGTQWIVTILLNRILSGSGGPQTPLAGQTDAFVYWTALLLGTGTGFIIKYILDKKFIFYYRADSFRKDLYTFVLYCLMAVVTTAIFWGTEYVFAQAFPFAASKYVGGFIGLCTGYTVKYQLDKHFVFKKTEE